MSRHLKAFLILSLLLAPVRAQTGLQLTESVVAGGGGVSSQGSFRVEGTVGQQSAGAQPSAGATYSLYGGFFTPPLAPSVQSVMRSSANPAPQNSSVGYVVTFNTPVTGVNAADFQLTTSGLTGASVTGVSGAGSTYDVTVDVGTPASPGATLRLDVLDDDTVVDAELIPLGGAGAGNGNYASGEVYTVNPNTLRANGARLHEPAAGAASMLFTVALSYPARAGGVSVSYATADGGATPATGGASCGGAVDYESASGSLNFAAGERVKTVSVNVCADTAGGEPAETLFLNLSGATGATIQTATAAGTILQGAAVSAIIISELRTSGPGGAGDDFVEIYNNTDFDQDVSGFGLFKTGASCSDTPVLVAAIPGAVGSNTTVLPGRAHYLFVGSQYSLANHGGTGAAAGDRAMLNDIEDDRSVALFSTSDVADLSTITRYDAVGFGPNSNPGAAASAVLRRSVTKGVRKGLKADVLSAGGAAGSGGVCDLMREGNTLAPVSGTPAEHSYFRRQCDFVGGVGCTTPGVPKDTGDNAADFTFADTQATPIDGVQPRLGAPGPENRVSPVRRDNAGVGAPLLDGSVAASAAPNRVRGFASDAANNSTLGTLTVRRRVVNNTGGGVTRLRFRIIEMTTYPAPAGTADLRARTSVDEVNVGPIYDWGTCAAASAGPPPCSVTVRGLTLEEPPAQPHGGGVNATFAAGTVTLATPLADGASLPVSFLLGLQATGTFRFYIIVEALP